MKRKFMKRSYGVAVMATGLGLLLAASPAAAFFGTGVTDCWLSTKILQALPNSSSPADDAGWVKAYPELLRFNGYRYVHDAWGPVKWFHGGTWYDANGRDLHWEWQEWNMRVAGKYKTAFALSNDNGVHWYYLNPRNYLGAYSVFGTYCKIPAR